LYGTVIGILQQLGPYPQSLGAGIDGGSNLKPGVLIEEDAIEDVAFSCAVFSDDCGHSDVFFLVGFHEPLHCLLVDYDFYFRERVRLFALKEMS
jgi:hypothetical protein